MRLFPIRSPAPLCGAMTTSNRITFWRVAVVGDGGRAAIAGGSPRVPLLRFFVAVFAGAVALLAALTVAHAGPRATRCWIERWAVKILTDPAARTINFTPRPTTVAAMRALVVPRVSNSTPRIRGIETHTYRVAARLVAAKRELDRDIHLVIAAPATGKTMIVEFPHPSCTAGARHRAAMTSALQQFLAACGTIPFSSYRQLRGTAVITGVGFVDTVHGQRGVAPNGIELHPALGFRSASCT